MIDSRLWKRNLAKFRLKTFCVWVCSDGPSLGLKKARLIDESTFKSSEEKERR